METIKKKVVIIGAGIAGLSAAEHLHSNGLQDFTVLEASDRIGGRIQTVKFGKEEKAVVELGANYIEGLSLSSSIVTLVNEKCPESFKITPEKCIEKARRKAFYYRSDGRTIVPELSEEMFELFDEEWIDEEPEDNPLLEDFYKRKVKTFLKKNKQEYDDWDADNVRAMLNHFLNYCKIWLGGPLKDLPFSAAGSYYEDEIPGGVLKVAGMSKLVEVLAESLPEAAVKLNHEVAEVCTREGGVLIKVADGSSYEAEHVIVTCSLGFLKQNASTMFKPPLSAQKMEAIDKIGFGKIGKIFLQYQKPFWTKGSGRMSLAWTNKDCRMKNDKQWYKNIEAFDEVMDNDNVLVCWVCNEGVDAIETMDEEQLKLECTAVLRKFLQNPSIPVPEQILRTTWASDRLSRGTYSYEAVETTDKHWDDLEEPIIEGDVARVMFAGEAIRSSGCIHGARDSGLREAERLLLHYNLQKVPEIEF